MTFSPIFTSETRWLSFNFQSFMDVGVTIGSATTTVEVYSGTDLSPDSLLSGAASISGATVKQLVVGGGGVEGVTYALTCTADLSDGQSISLLGYLTIKPTV